MNININNCYSNFYIFKEKTFESLTTRQKAITAICFALFSSLAIGYYLINKHYALKQKKIHPINTSVIPSSQGTAAKTCPIQKLAIPLNISNQPTSILISIFKALDLADWSRLSHVNRFWKKFSQHSLIALFLLEKSAKIPLEKRLQISKFAGSALKDLNLSRSSCAVTNEMLKPVLKVCSKIQTLNLEECRALTSDILFDLPPTLTSLDLSGWRIGAKYLGDFNEGQLITKNAIAHLPQSLQTLRLNGCNHLEERALADLPKNLKSLSLSFCLSLGHLPLDYLPEGLQALNIECIYQNRSHLTFLSRYLELRQLFLGNTHMTPDHTNTDIAYLPPNLNYLRSSDETDASLAHLPTSLNFLDLSYSRNLKDVNLSHLTHLCWLKLSYCDHLTTLILPPNLQVLELLGCPELPKTALAGLSTAALKLLDCDKEMETDHLPQSVLLVSNTRHSYNYANNNFEFFYDIRSKPNKEGDQ